MKLNLSPLEFFTDALERFQRTHGGEKPARLVISPESFRELANCEEVQKHLLMPWPGHNCNPMFRGVQISRVASAVPQFVCHDGRIELL
jgi:hypothetical protein